MLSYKSELHLSYMSGFMNREHRTPWKRLGVVCRRNGIQVHAHRSQSDRTVCIIVRVQDYRHYFSGSFSCHMSGSPCDRNLVFFKFASVYPCERIGSLRINDAITFGIDIVPPYLPRVISCHEKLRRGNHRQKNQEGGQFQAFQLHFFRFRLVQVNANLIIFYIFASVSLEINSNII